jgi:biotin-(acetyl-CoA carboxylase) ligase
MNLTSLVFTPIPVEVKSFNFRYIPLLTDLAAESDTFVIPTRFSEHLMNALDRAYKIWDEDNGGEVFNDERFKATLNEMVSLIKPDSQAYGLPDFSCDYFYPVPQTNS